MKRPLGVVLLSVLFSCLAGGFVAFGAWAAHIGHLTGNPMFIVGMAELLLGLMLFGFVAYELWDLDEDARWATFSMFAGPAGLATLLGLSGLSRDIIDGLIALSIAGLLAIPAVYLQLKPVKKHFAELIVLELHGVEIT
ncbi:MAG TPA: hypothetical protein VGL89_14930 [Candidatus Koribacter sp.]|jgi:hypothetical protein